MHFVKLHGCGNDYIVFEAGQLEPVGWRGAFIRFDAAEPFPVFVRRICARHFGAGADGVAVVERVPDQSTADFCLRIFNPDGSEAAMSGNGSRCAAAYLAHEQLWPEPTLRLSTRAGRKLYQLIERDGRGRYKFAAEIGAPRFASEHVPMLTDAPAAHVRNFPLDIGGGETVSVTALEMCNPNVCIFVADFEGVDWRRWGRIIESHPRFPARTNVEFIRIVDRAHIEARVWERGVGETLSSGTGACAAAVAACVNGLTDRQVSVAMPGGRLEVEWRADREVVLTGEAQVVYRGEWLQG